MALLFSPLSDELIDRGPRSLYPRHAFLMRQIGAPPQLDRDIANAVTDFLATRSYGVKDADSSTGDKDFLARILGLIRSTAVTIAVFSHQTRETALANIMLELGFAAMSGKPLMIVKSVDAKAPSDLVRTDWIDFDSSDLPAFNRKLGQALDQLEELSGFDRVTLEVALEAPLIDCAVAFERVQRGFLLTGDQVFVDHAAVILERIKNVGLIEQIDDLNRLRNEVATFVRQGRRLHTA